MVSYLPKQQSTAIILHKIPEKRRTITNTSHMIISIIIIIIMSHISRKIFRTVKKEEFFINQVRKIVKLNIRKHCSLDRTTKEENNHQVCVLHNSLHSIHDTYTNYNLLYVNDNITSSTSYSMQELLMKNKKG